VGGRVRDSLAAKERERERDKKRDMIIKLYELCVFACNDYTVIKFSRVSQALIRFFFQRIDIKIKI